MILKITSNSMIEVQIRRWAKVPVCLTCSLLNTGTLPLVKYKHLTKTKGRFKGLTQVLALLNHISEQ